MSTFKDESKQFSTIKSSYDVYYWDHTHWAHPPEVHVWLLHDDRYKVMRQWVDGVLGWPVRVCILMYTCT
jgi:hypothetical protein